MRALRVRLGCRWGYPTDCTVRSRSEVAKGHDAGIAMAYKLIEAVPLAHGQRTLPSPIRRRLSRLIDGRDTMNAMKSADHIIALRRDSNRITSAAEGRLDCIVSSCPGWQLADLVWHVGIVQMFWQMVARGALSGPEAWREPDRPTNDDLLAWFRGGVDLTATILESLDPDTPAWTWGHRNTVGFIRRRVAQETAVHCWDAAIAIGANEPLEQTIAVDGVDEFFDEVLPALSPDLDGAAQTICVRAHDTTDQWIVRTGEGSADLISGCDQADATVTATASDLLLFLWGRRSPNQVQVDGNAAALQRFLARASF